MRKFALFSLLLLIPGMACRPSGGPASPDVLPPYASPDPIPEPIIFAEGIVSTGRECNVVFSPDGAEAYFNRPDSSRTHAHLFRSRFADGQWQPAEKLAFSDDRYSDLDPFISPDGNRLYFASSRPDVGDMARDNHDIWYAEKTRGGMWGPPVSTGSALNSPAKEGYPTVARDGTMVYFSEREGGSGKFDLFTARRTDDGFTSGVRIEVLNTPLHEASPYIDPDHRFFVFYRIDEEGHADLFVTMKSGDSWGPAERLTPVVDSEDDEVCPTLSPDGRYLFFARYKEGKGNLYQVDLKSTGILPD